MTSVMESSIGINSHINS